MNTRHDPTKSESQPLPPFYDGQFWEQLEKRLKTVRSSTQEAMYRAFLLFSHDDDQSLAAGSAAAALCANENVAPLIVIVAGSDPVRSEESHAVAREALGIPPERNIVLDFPDGQLDLYEKLVTRAVCLMGGIFEPHLVISHWRDIHKDHQTIFRTARRVFARGGATLLFGEIPQAIDGFGRPNVLVRVSREAVRNKLVQQFRLFGTENRKDYFDKLRYLGKMRDLGIKAGSEFAEGFKTESLALAECPQGCGRMALCRADDPGAIALGRETLRHSRVVVEPCPECGALCLAQEGEAQQAAEPLSLMEVISDDAAN
jgi:hypothetical protein